uniref:Putative translation initiation factor 3 subunit a eif-3a n=1 Tax=Aedes albopictus TaxID=7160 RepID=A0A023ETF2_AEDAL
MYGRGNSGGRGQNGSKNYSARTAAGGGGGGASSTVVMAPVKNYQTVPADTGLVGSGGGAMLEGEWSSLNPSLYQNMSNEQVDWAALAQQWIQMKETLPADMVPAAPPPPIISESYGSNSRDSLPDGSHMGSAEEQGEAPMEVERDEDHSAMVHQQQQSANPWDNGSVSWQYPAHNEWRNPAWDSSWSSAVPNADKAYDAVSVAVNPNASLAVANWQAKMARIYKFGDPSNSNAIAGTVQPTGQSSHQQDTMPSSKRIPGLMDQVIKLDHHQDSGEHGDPDDDTTQTINDAKRKLLPAWIREGLEKMEREKQRQAEKEKEQQQRAEMLQQRRQAELEALNELEDAKRKSKFESDSEEDEPRNEDQQDDERQGADSPMPTRSREEILQELMIAVRKNLTEILLEVTNEEIALVAKETLAKTRRKGSRLLRLSANPGFLFSFCSIDSSCGLDAILGGFAMSSVALQYTIPQSRLVLSNRAITFDSFLPIFVVSFSHNPINSQPNQNCSSLCIHFVVGYPMS